MASFEIHGPFNLNFEKRKGGRTLIFNEFWSGEASYLCEERGCYVFAIRNKALTPIYVGKATKSFFQETFNASNKHKYQNGFSLYGKGAPIMYFVVHPKQKGKTNSKQIGEIEDFLIQAGVAKNPGIQNVKGAQAPSWGITGVIRGGAGKPNKPETDFANLFDIRH